LSGVDYREFIASVVKRLGYGGQYFAETVLQWNRGTIRKSLKELENNFFVDLRKDNKGRRSFKDSLPELEISIRAIVEPSSQTDPTFRSTRLYTPLTARQVRRRLIDDFGYKNRELPSRRALSTLLNQLGFKLKKVQKTKPLKKIPETNSIFDVLTPMNKDADEDPGCLRISIDAKAVVNIGPFARGGKSRQSQRAVDHDFAPDSKYTPYGLIIPQTNESWIWFSKGPATADFIVDQLEALWPKLKAKYNPHTLLINVDNGAESSGKRTQWLNRLVLFADKAGITIRLAYYPPYHSKYNPIERVWGILENHWHGEILDSVEKAVGLTRSMTYNTVSPVVRKVEKTYKKGVKLTGSEMKTVEARLQRLTGLEKWFIDISPIAT
jgi:hypothetical protein